MNPVARGIRNAFRNSIRTISIVIILGLSIGLSLTMLIANKAVTNKINTVKSSIGNTISLSAAGTQGFQGGGNPLSQASVNKLSSVANVTSVTESISDQLRNSTNTSRNGTTTSANTSLTSSIDAGSLGNRFGGQNTTAPEPGGGSGFSFTPPISAYGTTDTTKLAGTTITMLSGTHLDGTSDSAVAMVGSTLATKNNLKVGSTFTAYGTAITVVGIYDAGTTFENNSLVFSLPTLQRLSGQKNNLTSATVTVNSVTNIDSVTTAVKSILGTTADVTSSKDSVATAIQPLDSVKTVSTFSLIGATVAGAVIILLTMIMIVRERKKEIGVIKAIGGSNIKIVSEFMVESLTLALMGAVIGLIIGIAGGQPVTKLLVTNSTNTTATTVTNTSGGNFAAPGTTTTTRPAGGGFGRGLRNNQAIRGISNIKAQIGLSILAYGFGAAILIAIIGSGLAAAMIAKVRPSNVMRAD